MLNKMVETVSSIKKLWADGIYRHGGLVEWVREMLNISLDIVDRQPGQVGFQVLPRRWVVERTFAGSYVVTRQIPQLGDDRPPEMC